MRQLKRRNSIIKKLTVFLSVVLALECLLFTAFILCGGTVTQLDQNAMDILDERTRNRKNYLENEMVQRWSNLEQMQTDTAAIVTAFLQENGMDHSQLAPQDPRTSQLLGELSEPLISLMRRNSVTGAFLILDGGQGCQKPAGEQSLFMAGLYLRDLDPSSTPSNHSDLLMMRGSSDLVRTLDIAMGTHWNPSCVITAQDNEYYNPLLAAQRGDITALADMGYWSGAYALEGDEVPIVTYTQPLLDGQGQPYGVVGVELSVDYLRSLMPYGELQSDKTAAYILARSAGEGQPGCYQRVASSGPILHRLFGSDPLCQFEDQAVYQEIYRVTPGTSHVEDEIYASIQPFKLYNSNAPFSGQQWVLIGLMTRDELMSFSHSVSSGVLGLALGCLVLGTLLSVLVCTFFTRPIRTLAMTVRRLDPARPVELPPTNISEIDELSSAIQALSQDVAETSSRLSKIIDMAGIPLAAFQWDPSSARPYYTKDFFPLIGRPQPTEPLSTQDFHAILQDLEQYIEEGEPQDTSLLYKLPIGNPGFRWVQQQTARSGDSVLGVLLDVTDQVVERRRIEYERDYDLLTSLLNRRSFQATMAKLQAQPERLKIGAMLMMDLDNLKFLNDTYGHDCGDDYIRCAADVLRTFTIYGGVASRISGDEFHLFFSGYEDRQSLQRVIRQLQQRLSAASIVLPNGQTHKLRASVGIAWYPQDSTSLAELVRYADFAMYEAKNALKGSMRNFDIHTYRQDSYLLYSREELNRILEERALDYAFQPIVECRTGRVMGYEALMRPRSVSLPSPAELLRIARAQSKLPQVERLTWFCAMEAFTALSGTEEETLVFINSIPSQALTAEELAQFDLSFGPYLRRAVLELTESDELNADATHHKKLRSFETGMRIAVDDFGTGYSNDSVLLNVDPDFVKVDMSIIRGIHEDRNRQTLFRNLAQLCHEMGVQVIAEGVETQQELLCVVRLGADYIQGYYTGKPSLRPGPTDPQVLQALQQAWAAREEAAAPQQ